MRKITAVFAATLLATGNASADVINYTLDDLGGGRFQYNYTVDNSAGADIIDNIQIFFALGDYENLEVTASPADWDPLVLQPDPGLPDDGIFDALALVAGIDPGAVLGGFSVAFDWLLGGTPGDQDFLLFDFDFNLIGEGTTMLADTPTPVSEPAPAALLAVGLLLFGAAAWRRRRQAFVQH